MVDASGRGDERKGAFDYLHRAFFLRDRHWTVVGPLMDLSDAALRERAQWAREQTRGIRFYSMQDDEAMRARALAIRDAARAEQREAILKALCLHCDSGHVLDNGRVWAFCGAWKIINNPADEAEWAAAIRSQR